MCRFLKEVKQFITVRRTIRQIDISYLRRAVNNLVLLFLRVGQLNYSREITYLRQLLSPTVDKNLQRAILATSIVSKGNYGKVVAVDEELELYNLDYLEDISQFGNSTYDIAATFRNKALNREALKVYRRMFKVGISYQRTTYRIAKNDYVNVFSLVDKLIVDGLYKIRKDRGGALSDNIQQLRASQLMSTVQNFNATNSTYRQGITIVYTEDVFDSANTNERLNRVDRRRPADPIGLRPADANSFIELVEGIKIVDLSMA